MNNTKMAIYFILICGLLTICCKARAMEENSEDISLENDRRTLLNELLEATFNKRINCALVGAACVHNLDCCDNNCAGHHCAVRVLPPAVANRVAHARVPDHVIVPAHVAASIDNCAAARANAARLLHAYNAAVAVSASATADHAANPRRVPAVVVADRVAAAARAEDAYAAAAQAVAAACPAGR